MRNDRGRKDRRREEGRKVGQEERTKEWAVERKEQWVVLKRSRTNNIPVKWKAEAQFPHLL